MRGEKSRVAKVGTICSCSSTLVVLVTEQLPFGIALSTKMMELGRYPRVNLTAASTFRYFSMYVSGSRWVFHDPMSIVRMLVRIMQTTRKFGSGKVYHRK